MYHKTPERQRLFDLVLLEIAKDYSGNIRACLQDYIRTGNIAWLYKACQHAWGIYPPKGVKVIDNRGYKSFSPYSYELEPLPSNEENKAQKETA